MTQQKNKGNLSITHELTIKYAASQKSILLDFLNSADILEIDLSDVTDIDTAGLQLLIATKLGAEKSGKILHFTGHGKKIMHTLTRISMDENIDDIISTHFHPGDSIRTNQ